MHLCYPEQLVVKHQRIVEAFARIGKLHPPIAPCIPSPRALGYRNKLQMPVVWNAHTKKIGLYKKHSHDVVNVGRCFIQCAEGERILQYLHTHLKIPSVSHVLLRNAIFNHTACVALISPDPHPELLLFAQEMVEALPFIQGVVQLAPGPGNVVLGSYMRTLVGHPYLYEILNGKVFRLAAHAFFQVNPFQAEQLYTHALACAQLSSHPRVLDAYCGVGMLALFAAEQAQHVYGVECVPSAIEDARYNAQQQGHAHCTFYCADAATFCPQIPPVDVVFLNPPRTGCAPSLIAHLKERLPSRIIYISCDPATLARDCALLAERYTLESVQPFDMFPQTMHVECVVSLTKK